ncbi:hypothetical protein JCGZ_07635 [Jatropha curcas]|uniref:Uncharacterized protein n=1 Tax=Jatropha curcas TaxID=180498 RepID=A0A067KQG1_JATCU|nr:uncharacterized protein At4g33100 [Jatropha curcas]XP_037492903.1 uncharacterized protein At4g33100 [Jatropha curcas]XP_037492904.1 uncharacterized protein At4g33100 [Jatropha curcas]XP_037492905.1 uncharacterized protein At4g33100 [Jatropha curcas]XP_037492906.1 uncharacterized protein At4g33100 [Jatropha curcas]XP_037492907.1 uncharacterized protein At4g33100 [Jatropha curcas]KDP34064.1 hypothetical protein JCGZ_07635 [Jatropha curcas]
MGFTRKDKKTSSSSSSSSTSPCAQLRAAYHNCFNRWYSESFVKGQWSKEECVSEWEKYRACLSDHLEDKQLSRFLEAEILPVDLGNGGGGGGGGGGVSVSQ